MKKFKWEGAMSYPELIEKLKKYPEVCYRARLEKDDLQHYSCNDNDSHEILEICDRLRKINNELVCTKLTAAGYGVEKELPQIYAGLVQLYKSGKVTELTTKRDELLVEYNRLVR